MNVLEPLLLVLIENARRILVAQYGVDRAEPTFFQIIDLLRAEPELRPVFLALVRRTLMKRHDRWGLDEDSVPSELTQLVVHELRWTEFRELAEERLQTVLGGDRALAISDPVRWIADAYEDSWDDREFYRRYRE
ncbi:hypothetical protein NKI95_32310 [Mesorhizobium sp. M0306]|uniref:hypothetical protein n=1 Tax=Mesorhizobium sp. M0306 TaxID=2956932 RepID=UPI00333C2CB7